MKIAFDLRWVRSAAIDGISRYAVNLVRHLLPADPTHEYLLFGADAILRQRLSLSDFPNVRVMPSPYPLLSIKDFLFTPRVVRQTGVDLFHSPGYLVSPLNFGCRKIVTVFDLIPFLFPEELAKSRLFWRLFYKTRYPAQLILRSTDAIITSSANTRQDLVRLLNLPIPKIQVIGIGLDECFQPDLEVTPGFYERYHLPSKFLLYVGRQDPYKGLTYLVQAYALLPEALRNTYKLVIAGKTDPRYIGAVHDLIAQTGLQPQVLFPDYFPDSDLPRLYTAATILVQPSLYEGFGLTPLEAMACGTPVVYTSTSALLEVVGDAGLAVPPASSEALMHGIRQILEDDALRARFAAHGRQHVRRYSWQAICREILHLYTQLQKTTEKRI